MKAEQHLTDSKTLHHYPYLMNSTPIKSVIRSYISEMREKHIVKYAEQNWRMFDENLFE